MPASPNVPLVLSVKPGGFREHIRNLNRAGYAPSIAYRITVPDDLKFWYWLEFGTAGRQDSEAPIKTSHSGSYEIKGSFGKELKLGENRFAFKVEHPGIRPRLIYRGIRDELFEFAHTLNIPRSLLGITDETFPLDIKEKVTLLIRHAIELMGKRLDTEAPGTREGGRLEGRSAGEVWREEAQITEI